MSDDSLPLPLQERLGWPWQAEPIFRESSSLLPKISIVTPCLNSSEFIEECLRSVLLQGYPNLEYIVVDGGSTDGTIEIVSKYAKFLSCFISEPDSGQSSAINKGVLKSSGQLVNWLNADDILLPGALHALAQAYEPDPEPVLLSPVRNVDSERSLVWTTDQSLLLHDVVRFWLGAGHYHQPGIFVPRALWLRVGGLDEDLQICMDYELYCKFSPFATFKVIDFTTVEFRRHRDQKTTLNPDLLIVEKSCASRRYWRRDKLSPADKSKHDSYIGKEIYKSLVYRKAPLKDCLASFFLLCRETKVSLGLVAFFFVVGTLKRLVNKIARAVCAGARIDSSAKYD